MAATAAQDPRRFAVVPQLDIEQILKEAQQRWLRPTEICEILKNYRNFRIAPEPPNKPPSQPEPCICSRVMAGRPYETTQEEHLCWTCTSRKLRNA